MATKITRQTIDLSAFRDLTVIYLGMRVNRLAGLKTLAGIGPQISQSVVDAPDGLLLHEDITYSLFPMHVGMRQYWRDFESLERWSRSEPHKIWWKNFLRDSGGTGFWHETYFIRGGFEAVYDDMREPVGMLRFARDVTARGSMFTARDRLRKQGDAEAPVVYSESELYDD